MQVGKAIVAIRTEKNISQNKLAELANLNRGYVYKLENDQISPTIANLEKVAAALEIEVWEIIQNAEKGIFDRQE